MVSNKRSINFGSEEDGAVCDNIYLLFKDQGMVYYTIYN